MPSVWALLIRVPMATWARHEAQTSHHGILLWEVKKKGKMDPCQVGGGKTDNGKGEVVGLCFGRDLERHLADWVGRWAACQQHQLQHELYVCLACEHRGCERRSYFRDVSVTIQHAQEKTQDRLGPTLANPILANPFLVKIIG